MKTIIPKDALLCDVCNNQISDNDFIATSDAEWYEGYLYCPECVQKYKPETFLPHILSIQQGDNLSQTDLALPIIMEWNE